MKISGSGPVRPGTSRPGKKTGSSDEKFSVEKTEESTPASSAVSAGPVTSVDSLLALQEVPDAMTGRSKGIMRAEDMLDHLDDIRLGLLMGAIPKNKLTSLVQVVRDQRDQVDDSRLATVLDEIEVRAAVELAKLGHYD